MGQTGHGQIGSKLTVESCNSKYKTSFKGSKINTDLIPYVTKTLLKNK